MQRPGIIIGQKGQKYGLITRTDKQKAAPASRGGPAGGGLAAFGADSDSDEEVGAQVARQAARKVADSKVQDMYASALAEDPNAFEYDALYDSMQEQRAAPKQQEKLARQPKYIASLLEQAEVRKREAGITHERILLKERQKEDEQWGDTEKFVTAAYKRKLEEDRQWQESQRLKELDDERNDVTKLGHMNNFFANLTKNVAMGGAGSSQQQQQPDKQQQAAAAAAARSRSPPGSSAEPQAQQLGSGSRAAAAEASEEQQQASGGPPPCREGSRESDGQQQQQQHARDAGGPLPAQPPPQQQEPPAAAAPVVGGKRKNDDSAVAAARERFLARKRQQGA